MVEQIWRKSSRSTTGANCLEITCALGGIRIRDSKMVAGPQLFVTMISWRRFMSYVVVQPV
ncbi:DUF397 domain-containing protein [Streptomyces adustus]|uniref:DUF397 domain-containing protein n=2 Tax=Streptomyces adustus TaxID=1609272 RepID=A0A5N8VE56_9ACTN|nr:DUF397 domain-containing protein [Streptomyces adustus]